MPMKDAFRTKSESKNTERLAMKHTIRRMKSENRNTEQIRKKHSEESRKTKKTKTKSYERCVNKTAGKNR